jgi:GrpB-like predicted nucleotidyltransferase (UPF0157 family)
MLSVGIVGNDADRRAAVADLVGLGALVVEPGSELVWDVVAPLIAIHDCEAKGSCRIRPLQIVVGAGSAPEEASEADVWMGDGDVGKLWETRLVPFERNLREGRRAPRRQYAVLVEPDSTWRDQARRLMDRLAAEVGDWIIRIDHIGSTSVPRLPAKDLVDIQVVVENRLVAYRVAEDARRAGFVHVGGTWFGTDKHGTRHPEEVVVDADPGRPANVNIRPVTVPVWREALLFRDWLGAHDDERESYATMKQNLASRPGKSIDDYRRDKMPWIRAALRRAERWRMDPN